MATTKNAIESDMERPLFPGRTLLWFGCVSILGLMCFNMIDIALSLKNTSATSDAMITSFRNRARLLEELRSVMIRPGALSRNDRSSDPSSDDDALMTAHQRAVGLLDEFGASLQATPDSSSRTTLTALRKSVDTYWALLSSHLHHLPSTVLSQGIASPSISDPLRNHIYRLSNTITALNNQQLSIAEAQLHSEQHRLQNRLLLSSLLEFIVVFALIITISLRIRRTERYAETQYRTVVDARTELRNLAGQLETAQEEERRKLSRELHDELGQTMAAILVELGRMDPTFPQGEPAAQRLAWIKAQMEHTMRSIRDIALLLRPSMLDDLGLVPALKWQGREIARRAGLSVHVDAEDVGDPLPDIYRTCIYRIVQETLNNITKHASATSITIALKKIGGRLDLSIRDDGCGFDPFLEKGLGLLGIEERVARLSGRVEVHSDHNRGTLFNVSLPVPFLGKGVE